MRVCVYACIYIYIRILHSEVDRSRHCSQGSKHQKYMGQGLGVSVLTLVRGLQFRVAQHETSPADSS